jgi:sterol desaturase/sphingolipid hydroxylase (fatty acid hydroxylase superfamily)
MFYETDTDIIYVCTYGVEQVLYDFCTTMLPATLLASFAFTLVLQATKSEAGWAAKQAMHGSAPRPAIFAVQWLVVRLVVDVVFFTLHYAMHWDQSRKDGGVYNIVHRRHHEHRSPHVWTNYHFSILDLILEGFAPYGAALLVLDLLMPASFSTSPMEEFGLLGVSPPRMHDAAAATCPYCCGS